MAGHEQPKQWDQAQANIVEVPDVLDPIVAGNEFIRNYIKRTWAHFGGILPNGGPTQRMENANHFRLISTRIYGELTYMSWPWRRAKMRAWLPPPCRTMLMSAEESGKFMGCKKNLKNCK
jgi:hypothetical protein